MKLIEALEVLRGAPKDGGPPWKCFLASSFTPLHLQTFVAAELQKRLPLQPVVVETGLFGDLAASLEQAPSSGLEGMCVAIEWPDLDPRLGLRRAGGDGLSAADDVVTDARAILGRLETRLTALATSGPVAVSLPTLPLSPLVPTPGWLAGALELALRSALAGFAERLAAAGVRIVSGDRLAELSPATDRLDAQGELLAGFPYSRGHAWHVAALLVQALLPPAPRKGLITDLDGTLWAGILGEDGVAGISWDLEHHSQSHGLYQQLLRGLSDSGTLLAAASKNDPELVSEALQRDDLVLPAERLAPVEASWGPKSAAVARILEAWNVGSDSVVFVDDSPMERAEVQAAWPEMLCLSFPEREDASLPTFLTHVRDLFAKPRVLEEDRLRRESLRANQALRAVVAEGGEAPEAFLERAEARIEVAFAPDPADPRVLELVSKTNQFNLNGRRPSEAAWRESLERPGAFVAVVSYEDKYGRLGRIAVLAGREDGARLDLETFVLSCRAFSRRIEHRCIERLFARFDAREVVLDFTPTPRNGPLRDFFGRLLGRPVEPGARLSREDFAARCPRLFDHVEET
jgi:FkbH-like protein